MSPAAALRRTEDAVCVREEAIVPGLDTWPARLFDPNNLDATIATLTAAGSDDFARAVIERAERTLGN